VRIRPVVVDVVGVADHPHVADADHDHDHQRATTKALQWW